MSRNDEQLSDDAKLLDRYLNQYKYCINTKKNLERRKNELQYEFDHPLTAVRSDGMPGGGNGSNMAFTGLLFRLDEINSRINNQIEKSTRVLMEIMDVIDFLPENSMERIIIEHKYIDRFGWDKICKTENITKTPAVRYWRKGLYKLLEFKKIKQGLIEYKQVLEKSEAFI